MTGTPVMTLAGVGPKRAELLSKLGITDIESLLRHYPVRYEDRRRPVAVRALRDGETALTRLRVRSVMKPPAHAFGHKGPRIPMKVVCEDVSGVITLLFFNARWLLAGAFREGAEYWVYGTARRDMRGISMAHPDFEEIRADGAGDSGHGATGIVPVYALTAGLSQKYLRGLARAGLAGLKENAAGIEERLPRDLIRERRLAPLNYALAQIHFPKDERALNAARYRLIYEELFLLQVRLLYIRAGVSCAESGMSTCGPAFSARAASALFPYELTDAQKRAIGEIRADMSGLASMNRLLQGDVGSGKTAVAAAVSWFAAKSGFQTAIMAPTEILAAQHAAEFERLFTGTGICTALLTSGLASERKREIKESLASGDISVIIGTHALIEPDVEFLKLGLVITDEQHRFGVRQRMRLRRKGAAPDTLVMTATPIPRTLALLLYADLDISVLDELPPGREPVVTKYVDSSKREAVYDFAEREMAAGKQVYVVAPKVGDEAEAEESYGLSGSPLLSALGLAEELAARFPHRRVAAIHGRMKGEVKEAVMRAFASGEIDLLAGTVVIEVGLNVPNATMMIVENAERFGLAQLHQLRGRVGRGTARSSCVLISDAKSELAVKRCETLARERDGFRIAELDLKLRGPGDIFGTRQHGLPELRIADPAKHMDILQKANGDARELLRRDPKLDLLNHAALRETVQGHFGTE